jgi:hypothetical protein
MTIAVVELHEVIQFLEAKEKATRVIPPHLDPARNKELAQKIDRYNHIEGEIRKQRSVLQTRELVSRRTSFFRRASLSWISLRLSSKVPSKHTQGV